MNIQPCKHCGELYIYREDYRDEYGQKHVIIHCKICKYCAVGSNALDAIERWNKGDLTHVQ